MQMVAPRNFLFGEEPRKSMKTMHQMHQLDVFPVTCMCACESDLYVIRSITTVEKNKQQEHQQFQFLGQLQ